MAKLEGTVDGRPASVTIDQGHVSLEVDGAIHGPKTIAGSLSNEDKGRVWTIGLGTIRVRFVPNDPGAFNETLSQEIAGTDPAALARRLFEMSPSVAEGVASMNRLFDMIEETSRVFGETPPDYTSVRESFELLKRQHADFLQYLAPRGWAHSEILENPLRNHAVAVKFLQLDGSDPDVVDEWLADRVIEHPRAVAIVQASHCVPTPI